MRTNGNSTSGTPNPKPKPANELQLSRGASIDKAMKSAFGFDAWGYDSDGYNKAGFNRHGQNRTGLFWHGYDAEGYDFYGYNYRGYDRNGLDKNGADRNGSKGDLRYLDCEGIRSLLQLSDFVCVYIDGYSQKHFKPNGINGPNEGTGYGIFWQDQCVYNFAGSVEATLTGFDACLFAMYCALGQVIDIVQHRRGYRFFLICRNPHICLAVTEFARSWTNRKQRASAEAAANSKTPQKNLEILQDVSHQIARITGRYKTDIRFGFPMHGTDLHGIRIATWLAIHAASSRKTASMKDYARYLASLRRTPRL